MTTTINFEELSEAAYEAYRLVLHNESEKALIALTELQESLQSLNAQQDAMLDAMASELVGTYKEASHGH